MSTKAQIKANQQNAQKSTGPQTAEGKAAVSQNAVRHGLFAAEAVIQGEDPSDYELYRDKYLAELLPVGMVESMLAERIVSLWWRLRRAERMQNEAIEDMIGRKVTNLLSRHDREYYYSNQRIRPGDPRYALDDLPLGRIAISDWSHSKVLDRMLMYERRIENSVIKIMKELKRFQVMRRIELQNVEKIEPSTSLRDEDATRSNPPSLKDEAAAPKTEKHGDLKKQSQYAVVQLGARSYIKRDYGNKPAGGDDENKPKQSQIHAAEQTKGAGKSEKSLAAANSLTG